MQRNIARTLPVLLILVFALGACGGKKNHRPDPVEPVETGPTATELFTKGNKSLDAQKWEAAIASYDEALQKKDAEQWEIQMNRGIALSRLAKFDDALAAFEAALRNGGEEQPSVYFNLGNLYQDRGMYSAAIDAYRASLAYEEKQNVDTLVNLGAAYLFLRQWDAATATYEYTRQIAPDDPRPLHGIALVKQMQDQYRDAAELYEQVHGIDPNFALAYFNQARCYSLMKDYNNAIRAVSEFIRLDPNSAVIGRARGMLKRYKKKLEEGK